MISIERAIELIGEHTSRLAPVSVPLGKALHQVLANDIVSDIDSPPYDKALMDGFAVQAADVLAPTTTLQVIESVMAGDVPTKPITSGTATRIMTGGPLPEGADAVVVIEQTSVDGDSVTINCERNAFAEQNLLRRGTCIEKDQVVLTAGSRLRAGQIGLLAEVGADPVAIMPRPKVSVLVTGNELVPPGEAPGPGKIRNSNGPMIASLAEQDHADVTELGIGRDDPNELQRLMQKGLEGDVLILSGGVSAGDLDLVPQTLESCGVKQVFHKVRIKPGKPIWFGVRDQTLVFGLPGNPVSSFVCYLLFARAAVLGMQGVSNEHHWQTANMMDKFENRGDRPVYYPASRDLSNRTQIGVRLLPWKGSADLRTLAAADCLACLPARSNFAAGDPVEIMIL
ncbi:MAG: gephyrin-like molybdotransferase Glp [Planctomycetota bacterium]